VAVQTPCSPGSVALVHADPMVSRRKSRAEELVAGQSFTLEGVSTTRTR
jgi:hypothetical protein